MYKRKKLQTDIGKRQFYRRVVRENEIVLANLKTHNDNVNICLNNTPTTSHSEVSSVLEICSSSETLTEKNTNIENYPELSDGDNPQSSDEDNPQLSDGNNPQVEAFKIYDSNSSLYNSDTENLDNVTQKNDLDKCVVSENTISSLTCQLRDWAIETNVSHHSVTRLLKILNPMHPELPLDSRSLLKTPRTGIIKKLNNGEYCHFGVQTVLKTIIPESCHDEKIHISINIDGLPLFSSSNLQFWPILAIVRNFESYPFAIGIFCGRSKPSPLNAFLEDMIDEINYLGENGFNLHGRNYFVKILNFICDSPAKAYLKCIKSHGGYSSCGKCWEVGSYDHRFGKVLLKGTTCSLRTDEQFVDQMDDEHHKDISPLLKLNVGLVSSFTLDYMHVVCLGVVKKLLVTWVSGSLHVRLKSATVKLLSENLLHLKQFVPSEFNRKPRALSDLAFWKATEFRNFLLYFAPSVLKRCVDVSVYEHFLLLHVGILILVSPRHLLSFGAKAANNLLLTFIKHCDSIYGSEFYVFNTHSLCHLAQEAERFGTLDCFSAFPFENFLGLIKSFIRSPSNPLQQIYRRLSERNFIYKKSQVTPKVLLHGLHYDGPTLNIDVATQYKKLTFQKNTFCIKTYLSSDAYCMTLKGTVLEIQNICCDSDGKIFFIAKKFLSYKSLYNYPLDSMDLNIYILSNLSDLVEAWDISQILTKCFVFSNIEDNVNYVSFPLLHNFE